MQTKLTLPLIGMSSKDSALATTPGGTGGEGELTAADPISQAEIVSSQTITSRSRTVETTTYSLQVGYVTMVAKYYYCVQVSRKDIHLLQILKFFSTRLSNV